MGRRRGAKPPKSKKPHGGGASQLDSAAASGDGSGAEGSQITDTVKLPEASGKGSGSGLASSGETASSEGQASAEAPLISKNPKPATGEVRSDGLVYRVLEDGASVALVGWSGEAPEGDVSVPASVSSGADSFAVTAIGVDGADEGVFSGAAIESVSIPASVDSIADGALSDCPTLERVSVSSDNETYASFDGMLFSKDLTSLLLVPEGKEGAARIPDPATSVPAGAFSRTPGLFAVVVGEGSAAFSSRDGLLYSKDMKELVACPPGAGDAAVIPGSVESIGSQAFAVCAVSSITALGFVRDIAADAFDAEARAGAVVALPAGDDYEARKAVWKAAGFEKFKEPAKPGDVSVPEPPVREDGSAGAQASGLAYEVLDDYTLAVTWQGAEGPEGDLEIPATAEVGGVSYRVSAVADAGFAGCSNLTGVTLPASVTSIGERAFEVTGISDVWLPASVESVGERAFAACPSLERIVSLGSPWVADSALAECSGVSVYAPSDSDNPWNVGLPAAGNHLMPYGVELPEEPLALEVGQSASVLENGQLDAPEPVEVSYAYAAKPLSVDQNGTATGKAEGSSEVAVTLSLDGVELARATRAVEVISAETPIQNDPSEGNPDDISASEPLEPAASQISQTISLMTAEDSEPVSDEAASISETVALATKETFTAEAPTGQMLKYTVLADKSTVEVSWDASSRPAGESKSGSLVIPATVSNPSTGEEYVVKGVAERGFYLATVTAVSFAEESQVSYFGYSAFEGCQVMRLINLPDSLVSIGSDAFSHCFSLQAIDIPDSVQSIGRRAFLRCLAASCISIGAGVTELPNSVFYGDFYLKTLEIRGDVTTFGENLFEDFRPTDVEVYVPSSEAKAKWEQANESGSYGLDPANIIAANELCSVTFKECGDLQNDVSIRVEKGSPVNLVSAAKQGYGLAGWYEDPSFAGERWDFTQPVTGDLVLYPRWVEEFEQDGLVFSMQPDRAGVSVRAHDIASLQGDLVIPDVVMIDGESFNVTSISDKGFGGAKIDSVVLPAHLECIQLSAFNGSTLQYTNLGTLTNLEEIDSAAFGNTKLKEVVIPASVQSVKRAAFHTIATLESVEFAAGSSVSVIPDECFHNCTGLTSVVLPQNLQSIEYLAFENCPKLTGIDLPEGLAFIGSGAFNLCSLKSVVVPSSVKEISNNAFRNNLSLISVSLPAGLQKLGTNVFGEDTALAALSVRGSMTVVSDCLKGTAFSSVDKNQITVVLPEVSEDGENESYDTMKAAWTSYGFSKFAVTQGTLLTENDTNDGRWELSSDGTLRIWCERYGASIAPFGWNWDTKDPGRWAPVRKLVKRIVMDPSVEAEDMEFWFMSMNNLTDISGVFVPNNTRTVYGLFNGSGSLSEVPSSFTLPKGLEVAGGLFQNTSISALPEDFNLPSTVTSTNIMFGGSKLASLPTNFRLPDDLKECIGMFQNCTQLTSLPEGFRLPNNPVDANNMFNNCSSLQALPEGFTIPEAATGINSLFKDCKSLASLPEGFAIPQNVKLNQYNMNRMFAGCDSLAAFPSSFDFPLAVANASTEPFMATASGARTYYEGSSEAVKNYDWASQNRTLITPEDQPSGAAAVKLNVKAAGESGTGTYWTTAYTDASGMLTEPDYAPSRTGYVFTLWYADEACTQRVDFKQAFSGDTTLYGVLAPGTQSGSLPMANNVGSAFWSLADDGTLYVRSGAGVVDVMWPYGGQAWTEGAWGPYRNLVRKVSLDPALNVVGMNNWFRDMANLVDIYETSLPETATVLHGLFADCTSIESIPEGFSISSKATNLALMFKGCTSLRSVPESFKLSNTITNVTELFHGCANLISLPRGFSIPESALSCSAMFAGCEKLTTLPESFSFPFEAAANGGAFTCNVPDGQPRVATYYAGSNRSVLDFDWESQGRTLVTDSADMDGFGMRQATFKVQSADADAGYPWEVRSSAWSNRQGVLADPGTPQLAGYTFSGWCTDEACTEPFDFTQPLAEATTLYGKWAKHGGRGTQEGALPVESPDGSAATADMSAWWRIDADGTLNIRCEGGASIAVSDLTWDDDGSRFWERHASAVRSLNMHQDVKARSMAAWFKNMVNLEDVRDGFFIPDNCANLNWLFYGDEALKRLPSGMFPSTNKVLEFVGGMFQICSSLSELPADFALPGSVRQAWCMFQGTAVAELPEGFTLPEGLFNADKMFHNCWNLSSLPENLVIPSSATYIRGMFAGCPNLTSIPGGLLQSVSQSAAGTINDDLGMFGFTNKPATPVPTYFPAPEAQQKLIDWTAQGRALLQDPAAAGKALVELRLPNADGKGSYLWKTLVVDVDASLAEPAAPARTGSLFEGWYADEACTAKASFPLTVSGNTKLFAKYLATSGPLPTTDGALNASWDLSADGTLAISCNDGATIADLDLAGGRSGVEPKHWEPFRSQVKRVLMDKNVKAQTMDYWFLHMKSLTDAQVHIPDGVTSVRGMFNSTAITTLPDGFCLPDSVVDAHDLFIVCRSLSKLPKSFTISANATDTGGMFYGCTSLKSLPAGFTMETCTNLSTAYAMFQKSGLESLPEGFKLPPNLTDAGMLFDATNLAALPDGFVLPETLKECWGMFRSTKLKTLPRGFTFPASVTNASEAFNLCGSLVSLPEGFAISNPSMNVGAMFQRCASLTALPSTLTLSSLKGAGVSTMFDLPDAKDPVTTYYAGDASKLLPAGATGDAASYWKSTYQRTLVTNPAELPEGMHALPLKIKAPNEATWAEWTTLLTDASGVLADPGAPTRFGYAFSGWCIDEACTQQVDFSKSLPEGVGALYGSYTLVIKVTAPLAVEVTLDASGTTSAPVRFKSSTPVPLRLASIESSLAPGATLLFPDENERKDVEMDMRFGSESLYAVLPGSPGQNARTMDEKLPAATASAPGLLEGSLSIDLHGARVGSQAIDDITSFSTIVWTVRVDGLGSGTGNEQDAFYLKDKDTGEVYSAAEVKAHADAIASGDAAIEAAYRFFMNNEDAYECWTTWGGVAYEVRIIGINHDDKSDGAGKAGLTFQFKNLLNDAAPMNPTDTNDGGWGASVLRSSMNERSAGTIGASVPQDLWDAIVQVDKGYTASSTTDASVTTSPDKLFIASYHELTGSIWSGWLSFPWLVSEGAQYEFYQSYTIINNAPNDILKKMLSSSGSSAIWWQRSVDPTSTNGFTFVYLNGNPRVSYYASASYGVCPCFCL